LGPPFGFLSEARSVQDQTCGGQFLGVDIAGGLILDRDSEAENYGAYFICNNRLVVKEHGCLTPALFTSGRTEAI
jgi:hypothetical protein